MRRCFISLIGFSLAFSSYVGAQDVSDLSQHDRKIYAQRHFEEGLVHFDGAHYAEALSSFERSQELFDSPNTRLYIARSLVELGNLPKAANHYEEVIRAAALRETSEPRYEATRVAATKELEPLRKSLSTIVLRTTIDISKIASVTLNGDPVPTNTLGLPIYVLPGEVHGIARLKDGRTAEAKTNAKPGQRLVVNLEPRSPSDAPQLAVPAKPDENRDGSVTRTVGLVSGISLAAIGWGTFATFSIMADEQFDELEATCSGPCPTELQHKVDRGETYDTLATIGMVAGAIGSAVTLGLVIWSLSDNAPDEKEGFALQPNGVSYQW